MNSDLVAQHAIDRLAKAGVAGLNDFEKTAATVWLFEAGVRNEGFAGYYLSRGGDLAFNAPTALQAVRAPGLAAIATEANAIFGPEGPSSVRQARRKQIRALPPSAETTFAALERRYAECDEDVDELLEQFLDHAGAAR